MCPTDNVVYLGKMVPPLERFERREEPEAQGGEFVEAYVAKRTKQISPTRALALDASATSAGSDDIPYLFICLWRCGCGWCLRRFFCWTGGKTLFADLQIRRVQWSIGFCSLGIGALEHILPCVSDLVETIFI